MTTATIQELRASGRDEHGVEGKRSLLSDAEVDAVIMAALRSGAKTEDELARFGAWAEGARIDATLLDLVVRGEVVMSFLDGEIAFHARGLDTAE